MLEKMSPPQTRAGSGDIADNSRREDTAPPADPQHLSPERRAALGIPAGCEVVPGEMCWWTSCPSCSYGNIPLLPDENGRLVPSTIGHCYGKGWRCSSRRIAEAWEAALAGVELAPTPSECRLTGSLLVRRFPDLWFGRRGRDSRAALWAVARELDRLEIPPRLIKLGLEALAARRGWPARLVREVLR